MIAGVLLLLVPLPLLVGCAVGTDGIMSGMHTRRVRKKTRTAEKKGPRRGVGWMMEVGEVSGGRTIMLRPKDNNSAGVFTKVFTVIHWEELSTKVEHEAKTSTHYRRLHQLEKVIVL